MMDGPKGWKARGLMALTGFLSATAICLLWGGESRSSDGVRKPIGQAQLVAYEPLPAMDGEGCLWMAASAGYGEDQLFARAALWAVDSPKAGDPGRAPRRVIRDPDPTYSAIAVNPSREEVVLQDENLFQILVYNRLDNTPPRAAMTEPKRAIGGIKTKVEFNCGLYVDPKNGDIYSVNNDTVDTLVVFSRGAEGNVPPDRELRTPHRTFGIAVDEKRQELFLTVQHPPQVVVYRKNASGNEKPVRTLEGPNTQLEDAHGIALDAENGLMFVSNHGSASRSDVAGSGRFEPPSITVYPLDASGDTPPVRVVEGPNTQLNWPAGLYLDAEHGELFVANDVGNSILVFRKSDRGNVAPLRVVKGPRTGIRYPTGVSLDSKNNELWVSNMGNHSATVYPRTADGDVAPLRTIRAAPRGKLALAIGNPGAVAYDRKREEVLVPN